MQPDPSRCGPLCAYYNSCYIKAILIHVITKGLWRGCFHSQRCSFPIWPPERGRVRLSHQNGSLFVSKMKDPNAGSLVGFVTTNVVCNVSFSPIKLKAAKAAFNQLEWLCSVSGATGLIPDDSNRNTQPLPIIHKQGREGGNNWSNFFPKWIILIHFSKAKLSAQLALIPAVK